MPDSVRGVRLALHRVTETQEFLGIVLARERYAVPLGDVQEILNIPRITDVPRSPRHVIGVVSVRGVLVTIIDVRVRLGLEAASSGPASRVLLTRTDQDELVGLFVDGVQSVVRLSRDQIEPPLTAFGSELSPYLRGIGRSDDGEMLVLLDISSIVG
jgi:purine-binding chemotaxis protein CheW